MTVDNPLGVLVDKSPAKVTRSPVTGTVVRSDSSGVFCVPLGSDPRVPIGPCRGAIRRVFELAGAGDLEHRHDHLEQLPAGMVVLIVFTQEQPWVAAWEES